MIAPKKIESASVFVHPTAIVESPVILGDEVRIWHFVHIRKNAKLGKFVSLGRDVFVDEDVEIGDHARVQNGVSIYKGVDIGPWCFVGPHVIFTNDLSPRVGKNGWEVISTILEVGSSLGAGTIVRCGVKLGAFSLTGAGSVITKDVPPFTLVYGSPGRKMKRICACADTQFELSQPFQTPFCISCKSKLPAELIRLAQQEFEKLGAQE